MSVIVTGCTCFCVRLGLGLLPLLDQFRPLIKCGAYFLPATLPAIGWCLCPQFYLWFSLSGAGFFVECQLTPGGCLPGPGPPWFCRASAWGMMCPMVSGSMAAGGGGED
ncbi:hypothetical protein ATANTOWER_007761 [Ataeniobius toweri]|uniref:Uncharacterized protein n=1 Tax=Ataeniobius toweri TaxID=208326 RepID=A0ABU7C9K6_9TELE|nr:hypothetical protein [Ataeniobius toweri]